MELPWPALTSQGRLHLCWAGSPPSRLPRSCSRCWPMQPQEQSAISPVALPTFSSTQSIAPQRIVVGPGPQLPRPQAPGPRAPGPRAPGQRPPGPGRRRWRGAAVAAAAAAVGPAGVTPSSRGHRSEAGRRSSGVAACSTVSTAGGPGELEARADPALEARMVSPLHRLRFHRVGHVSDSPRLH